MGSPNATTLDAVKVEDQAKVHEQTRDDIASQLDLLKNQVDNLLNASSSEATKALHNVTDGWVASVKNSVLEHMTAMVKNLRGAINDQTDSDGAAAKALLDIPLVTNQFLAG